MNINESQQEGKIVLIPSCHNTPQLINVLAAFPAGTVDEICIVVDDPKEGEVQLIEEAVRRTQTPFHIIENSKRKGVGQAIREGIDYAALKKHKIIIVMAGNGKDQPKEIPRLLKPIISENYDYVQGSRFLNGGRAVKIPVFRRTFSQLYPFFWTFLTKFRCTDVTNGFRAYKLSLFQDRRINIQQDWLDSYELEYYLHYKVITLGYRLTEVPVSKIYPFRHRGGYSNISPFKDWWRIVFPLLYLKTGIKK